MGVDRQGLSGSLGRGHGSAAENGQHDQCNSNAAYGSAFQTLSPLIDYQPCAWFR
jgi:hypothetical protein